jgi:hypothetical protein
VLQALMDEKKSGKNVIIAVVNPFGEVDRKFAELFGLTNVEVGLVQSAIQDAVNATGVLERENASVVKQADGKIVVEVKAFPERGGQIYDRLIQDISGIVGRKKEQAFKVLSAQALEHGLGFFGAADKTATLEWNPNSKAYALRETAVMREVSGEITSIVRTGFSGQVRPALLAKMRPALAEIVKSDDQPGREK